MQQFTIRLALIESQLATRVFRGFQDQAKICFFKNFDIQVRVINAHIDKKMTDTYVAGCGSLEISAITFTSANFIRNLSSNAAIFLVSVCAQALVLNVNTRSSAF